jgi:hypothetical protein
VRHGHTRNSVTWVSSRRSGATAVAGCQWLSELAVPSYERCWTTSRLRDEPPTTTGADRSSADEYVAVIIF